jgi:hypothetical protein
MADQDTVLELMPRVYRLYHQDEDPPELFPTHWPCGHPWNDDAKKSYELAIEAKRKRAYRARHGAPG